MKRIHVFKAGTHTASNGTKHTITRADIAEISANFAAGNGGHDAPLVIGHPQLNAPAYGWVSAAQSDSDDLYIEPRDVVTEFAEAVNAKRFPKVSISLWPRDHANNPVPGKLTLRHVGFLGAMAPSLKGLQEASFSDSEGCLDFSYQEVWGWRSLANTLRNLREWLIGKEGLEAADKIIPNYQVDDARVAADAVQDEDAADKSEVKAFNYSEADLSAREQSIAAREVAILAREQAADLAATNAQAAATANAFATETRDFADGLVKTGHLLPREREAVIELCMRVGGGSAAADFADGAPTLDVLKAFLSAREPVIDFSEKSGADKRVGTMEFSSAGAPVDEARLEIWNAAKAHQEAHGTTFDDALSAVTSTPKN